MGMILDETYSSSTRAGSGNVAVRRGAMPEDET